MVPGDRILVDGVVLRGHTAVDKAMLTGEAALVVNGGQGAVLGGGVGGQGQSCSAPGHAVAIMDGDGVNDSPSPGMSRRWPSD